MRISTVFFVLGLMALARADVTVFAEIDKHPFGSTLLDLVQINMQAFAQTDMKTEDTIDQLATLLANLQADMQQNKQIADGIHKDYQAKAVEDIALSNRILGDLKARKANVQTQLAEDKNALGATKSSLARSQAHLAAVVKQVQQADSANVAAQVAFSKKVNELEGAINSCRQAVNELSKLNFDVFAQGEEVNMIQIKSKMEKVEEALKTHLPTRLSIYKPIITALVDMGSKADPALVRKVIGLINELRNTLEAELSQAEKHEKVRVADYRRLRGDLINDERATNERIGRALINIRNLQRYIKANESILSQLNVVIPAQQRILADRQKEQQLENASYAQENTVRVDELKVLSTLQQHFAEKFQQGFSNYLRFRVKQ